MQSLSAKGKGSNTVVYHGSLAAKMIRDIAEATNVPYLKPISGISMMILESVLLVKVNKDECFRLTERIVDILYAIINLCHDTRVDLPPTILHNLQQLMETLEKISSYVRNQVDGRLLKRFIKQAENMFLLNECNEGIQHALNVFSLQSHILTASKLVEIQNKAERRHEEIMDIINHTSTAWSGSPKLRDLGNSSSSISILLPPNPKIFYGRDAELKTLLARLLASEPSRTSILGPGGIGKSSLALAALHDDQVAEKFGPRRYFLSCESCASGDELIFSLAAYFGIEEQGRLTKAIIQYLSAPGPLVLVLDNLETCWEPQSTRSQVEDFLSLLSELPECHIIVTMRGAERPANVRWTRPFIPPLYPLDETATRQIFFDITDAEYDEQVDDLLCLTDGVPLAITLMASLASYEGLHSVLDRWRTETVSVLSDGVDRRSNLETSIMISMSSPRMKAVPGAQALLSLLSILPDGATDSILNRVNDLVHGVGKCRTALCRTSLAYVDHGGRLKVLVPVREFVRVRYPPSLPIVRPVRSAMYDILTVFEAPFSSISSGIAHMIAADLGNLSSLIRYGLSDEEDLESTLHTVILFGRYCYATGIGTSDILEDASGAFERCNNDALKGQYYLTVSRRHSFGKHGGVEEEEFVRQSIDCFRRIDDVAGLVDAYAALYAIHYHHGRLTNESREVLDKAISLSIEANDSLRHVNALVDLSIYLTQLGENVKALNTATEGLARAKVAGNLYLQCKCLEAAVRICVLGLGDYHRAASFCEEWFQLLGALGATMDTSAHYRSAIALLSEIRLKQTDYTSAMEAYLQMLPPNVDPRSQAGETYIRQANPIIARDIVLTMTNIAYVDIMTGNLGSSEGSGPKLMLERLDFIRELFEKYHPWALSCCWYEELLGEYYLKTADLEQARKVYTGCLAPNIVKSLTPDRYLTFVGKLGETLVLIASSREGSIDEMSIAMQCLIIELVLARKTSAQRETYHALQFLGSLFLLQGDVVTAEVLFNTALDGFTTIDVHNAKAECFYQLGCIRRQQGDLVTATAHWEKADALFIM